MTAIDRLKKNSERMRILEWLKKINETDQSCIDEVLENMNSVPGYQEFIINYSRNAK